MDDATHDPMSRAEARARFRAAAANLSVKRAFEGEAVPAAIGAFATGVALGALPGAPAILIQQIPRLVSLFSSRP